MSTYIVHIRDEAPADEVRSALEDFADAMQGIPIRGQFHLWSSNGWHCGTVTPAPDLNNWLEAETATSINYEAGKAAK